MREHNKSPSGVSGRFDPRQKESISPIHGIVFDFDEIALDGVLEVECDVADDVDGVEVDHFGLGLAFTHSIRVSGQEESPTHRSHSLARLLRRTRRLQRCQKEKREKS